MVEASDGKKYRAKAAYRVDISRYDHLNANQRIYPKKLWENVIKEQKHVWDGALGLADHPEEEGSVKDAFCVWHNLGLNEKEKTVQGDIFLVGHYGEQAKEVIEAGGRLELSSSGFGELQEDDKTVDPTSYEIERPSDWVLHASQGVYGSIDSEQIELGEEVSSHNTNTITIPYTITTTTNYNKDILENNTNNIDNKEHSTMAEKDTVSIVEQKNLQSNLSKMMKEASQIEDIQDKITAYREVISFCEGIEDVDGVSKFLSEAENEINSLNSEIFTLAKKAESVDKLAEEINSLKEKVDSVTEEKTKMESELDELSQKYDIATTMLDEQKDYTVKLKDMYEIALAEGNGKVSAEEYKEALTYIEDLEEKISKLRKTILELSKNTSVKEAEDSKNDDDEEKEKDDDNDEKDMDEEANDKEKDANDEESDDKEKDTKDKDDEKEEKKESSEFDFRNEEEIELYYESLLASNPLVEKIKDKIVSQKTLFEAQKAYMKYEDLIYNSITETELKEETLQGKGVSLQKAVSFDNMLSRRKGWK
jgi:hypothetical protein